MFRVSDRANATLRGYDSRQRNARNRFLKANPLCAKATIVDHTKPHRSDKVLFWDQSNWQSICKSCMI